MRTRNRRRRSLPAQGPVMRHSSAAIAALLASYLSGTANAQTQQSAEVQFNDQFLAGSGGPRIDISRFSKGNPVAVGQYDLDVYVNGEWTLRRAIAFVDSGVPDHAAACFDKALVTALGIDVSKLSKQGMDAMRQVDAGGCVALASIVEGASYTYDDSDLRLDITVPQALLRRSARGSVDPSLWDAGVPSATLAYQANTFHSGGSDPNTQTYLGLSSGVNIGSWHLRQDSALTFQSKGGNQYQSVDAYLQHDLPKLRSQLTIGDAFTDGSIFDTMGFRGVQLATDDRMLPQSLRGYAPVIRGIAHSNARVTVTQNGNKLYETTVPPGPFQIDDLYATGYGGNLLVTVTEADGTQQSFTVPFASVTQSLRAGTSRYAFVLGTAREVNLPHAALFQATYQHGFSNFVTGYAGAIVAEGYAAGLLGAALNTPFGAVALGVTQARADIRSVSGTTGQSIRLSYAKFVQETGTNFSASAYRYSSSGFWTLRDALTVRGSSDGSSQALVFRRRNQLQVTANQTIGARWGTVFATMTAEDYWQRSGSSTQFQVGYNNGATVWGMPVAYSLSVARQRDTLTGRMNNQFYATVSVPLGRGSQRPTVTTSFANSSILGSSERLSVSGAALEDNTLTYGVNGSRGAGANSGGGNVQYRSPFATLTATASGGSGVSQFSGGMSGVVVLHPGGITLGNQTSETIGVIEAKGAEGARVPGAPGTRIDSRGYAVIPNLQAYERNTVDVDPKGLRLDVDMKSTSVQVAPRANAVVAIRFRTSEGRAAFIDATRPDGLPLPFAASVVDEGVREVGVVGQAGRILARGIADSGALTVKWGDGADSFCTLRYQLAVKTSASPVYPHAEAVCTAPINRPPDVKEGK